ncbi:MULTISPECIES: ImmA/IrrE family metallo-endopeptidase [Paenibacillus]|jgi:Zn-dependent peptidase ImmA (M78 family)|uniref:ImmA/IrrE family metallo-endopeptidase n=1 Tax=Paenibacillus TaxID=44249 RepID=UPI00240E3552|nr:MULTISPECIES: ImmA/IrrE family metallo-endopeptidase [Paenibacillus]MCI1777709.1 ImmA/IrrE family metallo-endopeptidase [Paenibacillus lautus]WFB57648.1 ImmA/IrrE family metallo-endopeptidase [Paenibacillus sp. BR1-192]
MFRYYETTPLEQFVERTYARHGIHTPQQLTVEELSNHLNIWIHYHRVRSRAVETLPGKYSIFLDNRLTPEKQWVEFLHELCHLLRHAGNQMVLPKSFTKAQEIEADHFVLYAAMPISMISKLSLPDNQADAIRFLASTFRVPTYVAKQRLEQIQRRVYQGKLLSETSKLMEIRNRINYEDIPSQSETTFYAYFDPSGDYIEPSQIIIQVDKNTLLTQEELTFSLDGPFKRIEESQLEAFVDCKPIKFNDLDYTRDGKISLKLSHLASRYYNSAFKFIVQRKDIEQVLNFYGADF